MVPTSESRRAPMCRSTKVAAEAVVAVAWVAVAGRTVTRNSITKAAQGTPHRFGPSPLCSSEDPPPLFPPASGVPRRPALPHGIEVQPVAHVQHRLCHRLSDVLPDEVQPLLLDGRETAPGVLVGNLRQ